MIKSFNAPINSVSFGQVSVALLRELFLKEQDVLICPIGGNVDMTAQGDVDPSFVQWIERGLKDFDTNHSRKFPTFKLWHLEKSSFSFISENEALMTFYELDDPTPLEKNIAKNVNNLIVTSKYTKSVFDSAGMDCTVVPLGFDKSSFRVLDKQYHNDDRIVFNLCGKYEFRKHHGKILQAWARKYGNDKRYALQCALFNPFISPEDNNNVIAQALGGEKYFNISFLPMMQTNEMYNDFLNSSNIIIGMSGGEGWGLPEFQSVALGKHSVILDAHAYQEWATTENSVLVGSTSKVDCVDGIFFKKGNDKNQGQIFDWKEDDFLSACDTAVERVRGNRVNEEGLKLQDKFTYTRTLEEISKVLEK